MNKKTVIVTDQFGVEKAVPLVQAIEEVRRRAVHNCDVICIERAESIHRQAANTIEANNLMAEMRLARYNVEDAQFYLNMSLAQIEKNSDASKLVRAHVFDIQARLHHANSNYKDALQCIKKAMDLTGSSQYYSFAARLSADLGREDEALTLYQRAQRVNKYDPYPLINKTQLRGVLLSSKEEKITRKLLEETNDFDIKHQLYFSLARHYERNKQLDLQFDALHAGNAIKRKLIGFPGGEKEFKFGSKIVDTYSSGALRSLLNNDSNEGGNLIFVVGFPRSGSTLTEQIICKHSTVFGVGESHMLSAAYLAVTQKKGLVHEDILKLSSEDINRIRDVYRESLSKLGAYQVVVDKSLVNYYLLGLLKIVFPKAKIVHVYKNPIDNCLGCYKQIFAGRDWPFIYSLQDLQYGYRTYHMLMKFWDTLFPGEILHLSYETLVLDFENTVRKLLKYCDLEWEDACLKFYAQDRAVKTASASQVRQGLFTDAIGRWRIYEKHLEPVLSLADLEEWPPIE